MKFRERPELVKQAFPALELAWNKRIYVFEYEITSRETQLRTSTYWDEGSIKYHRLKRKDGVWGTPVNGSYPRFDSTVRLDVGDVLVTHNHSYRSEAFYIYVGVEADG